LRYIPNKQTELYKNRAIISGVGLFICGSYSLIKFFPSDSIEFLLLYIVVIVLCWFHTSFTRILVIFMITGIPSIGILGSGVIKGISATTILFIISLIFLGGQLLIQKKTIPKDKLLWLLLVFVGFQFFSFIRGRMISPMADFFLINELAVFRDLFILVTIVFSIYLTSFNTIDLKKFWSLIITVSILGGINEVFEWLFEITPILMTDWSSAKVAIHLSHYFDLAPFYYFLPLNLIISYLIKNKSSPMIFFCLILFVFAILSSLQRILIVGLLLNLLLWIIYLKRSIFKFVLPIFCILLIGYVYSKPFDHLYSALAYSITGSEGTRTKVLGYNINSSGRFEKQWPMAIHYWKTEPLLGIGFAETHRRYFFKLHPVEGRFASSAHSLYLSWLSESGLIGLLIGLWFIYGIYMYNNRIISYSLKYDIIYEILMGLKIFWLVFLFINIFNSFFWTGTVTFLYFLLMSVCFSFLRTKTANLNFNRKNNYFLNSHRTINNFN
jgi:O-antigen ligase